MSDKEYFTATDPEGRNIRLYKSSWDHIRTGHPEVRSVSEVKSTIQKPHVITENTAKSSVIYTKIASSNLYLNVYARMADTKSGRVSTAFLQAKLPKGDVIWSKKS